MFIRNWKKDVLTIPNLLSLFRLALIPVYMVVYLNAREPRQFYTAGGILALSCFTDAIDGYIARRYNMVSTLGKILDPLADKITQFVLTFCLSLKYAVLYPVLLLFVVKEVFQALLGLLHLFRGKILPGALMTGKVCTTVLFLSLIALVLFPNLPAAAVKAIALTDSGFLLISFLGYLSAYFGHTPILQDLDPE